jgi:hypothetical protein
MGHTRCVSIKSLALSILSASNPVPRETPLGTRRRVHETDERLEFDVRLTARGSPHDANDRETCWHCGGSGECDCSTCGVMKALTIWAPGECVPCKAQKNRVQ